MSRLNSISYISNLAFLVLLLCTFLVLLLCTFRGVRSTSSLERFSDSYRTLRAEKLCAAFVYISLRVSVGKRLFSLLYSYVFRHNHFKFQWHFFTSTLHVSRRSFNFELARIFQPHRTLL